MRILGTLVSMVVVVIFIGAGSAQEKKAADTGPDQAASLKWEFKAVPFGSDEKESTKKLNDLAAAGWEYVGSLGNGMVAFKRPARSGQVVGPEMPQLLFTSKRTGNSEIYLMNLDGTGAKNLTNNPANNTYPAWSPDASKIAFISDRDGSNNIYVMDASGDNVKPLTKGPGDPGLPAWSPDGTKILFHRGTEKGNQLFVVDAQGGKEKQLTDLKGDGDGFDPCWSPDGKKIAFSSGRNGKGWHVYVMDADGGNVKEITTTGNNFGWIHTAWSPDGRKISYTEDIGGAVEVFVCDPDGKNHKQLTRLGAINTSAAWSPDSKQIIFQHLEFGMVDQPGPVYIMDADGGNQRILFKQDGPSRAAWKPLTKKKS